MPPIGKLQAQDLRLIPFPKEVKILQGEFQVKPRMRLTVSDSTVARQLASDMAQDLKSIHHVKCSIDVLPAPAEGGLWSLALSADGKPASDIGNVTEKSEGYRILISSRSAVAAAHSSMGLVWGIQTLRQLLRANMVGMALPNLEINDWPSLQYRGFQDDITRGPSPHLQLLQTEASTSSYLKMNFFTYYIEHQFEFKKHPVIGPKDGSLTQDELKALVAYAKDRGVEIIGCQQSFGHFAAILQHDEFKNLRETENILSPTNEDSYKLLDDMYSEQIPLTDSPFFNVCCDEVYGLGTGPAKSMVEKYGIGDVYADHMRRVHDIVKDKYGRRIMMWGDIITQYPKSLDKIPKDTLMLVWGYDARDSFEQQILPFAKSGYDFFVCPGVWCWLHILPDFDSSAVNIHNFVRDGVKLGAKGMLNTTWDDAGDNFFNYNWYGVAWGAECAWNGSTTSIEDFKRRIGAVLFGEKEDNFGQAISLLATAEKTPGLINGWDQSFWRFDNAHVAGTSDDAKGIANKLISLVDDASKHISVAKKQAKSGAEALDYYQFGADRLKLIALRQIEFIDAAEKYEEAQALAAKDPAKAAACLDQAAKIVKKIRDQHISVKARFRDLWNRENKPYALDFALAKYDSLIKKYDETISNINTAQASLKDKGSFRPAGEVAMDLTQDSPPRPTTPTITVERMSPTATWTDVAFAKRIGITLHAADSDRSDIPVEVSIPIAARLSNQACLYQIDKTTGAQTPVPSQMRTDNRKKLLLFLAKGRLAKGEDRSFFLYFQPKTGSIARGNTDLSFTNATQGGLWLQNDKVRLYIGPEGGHIYRWEVKKLNNLSLTYPGGTGWQGFADEGEPYRSMQNKVEVVESGDALIRIRCTDAFREKTISLWTGMPWVEVTFNEGLGWFWSYDDPNILGEKTATRGDVLFSDGTGAKVIGDPFATPCPSSQKAYWGAKFNPASAMLAIVTPERLSHIIVGPGGPPGGVGIENSPTSSHFAIYGGATPDSPKETLDLLRSSIDFTNPPKTTVYAVDSRK
jgi:hypothetical protein